jgi:cold shock protein
MVCNRTHCKRRNSKNGHAEGHREVVNSQKGYGFIQRQGSGKGVFVHISALERAGLSDLDEGQIVEFEEVLRKGKTSAEILKVHH